MTRTAMTVRTTDERWRYIPGRRRGDNAVDNDDGGDGGLQAFLHSLRNAVVADSNRVGGKRSKKIVGGEEQWRVFPLKPIALVHSITTLQPPPDMVGGGGG